MVAAADLPPLGEGKFYYFQLAGAEVMLTDGRRLGTIEDIMSTGAHDVWVVRDGEREVLVPVIADVVKAIDLGRGRVIDRGGAGAAGLGSVRWTRQRMEFHVITLFPELFAAANWPGMVGRALKAGLVSVEAHALREHRARQLPPGRRRRRMAAAAGWCCGRSRCSPRSKARSTANIRGCGACC